MFILGFSVVYFEGVAVSFEGPAGFWPLSFAGDVFLICFLKDLLFLFEGGGVFVGGGAVFI